MENTGRVEQYRKKSIQEVKNLLMKQPYAGKITAWKTTPYRNVNESNKKIDDLFGFADSSGQNKNNTSVRFRLMQELHLLHLEDYKKGGFAVSKIKLTPKVREMTSTEQRNGLNPAEFTILHLEGSGSQQRSKVIELEVDVDVIDIQMCSPPQVNVPRFHRVDYRFLRLNEGFDKIGYMIFNKNGEPLRNMGVTFGTGVDVGVMNVVGGIHRYIRQHISNPQKCSLYWRLYPYTLLKGQAAAERNLTKLELTNQEVAYLNSLVFHHHMIQFTRNHKTMKENVFRQMPADAQTLLADFIYQYGAGFDTASGHPFKNLSKFFLAQDWPGLRTHLQGLLSSSDSRSKHRLALATKLVAQYACTKKDAQISPQEYTLQLPDLSQDGIYADANSPAPYANGLYTQTKTVEFLDQELEVAPSTSPGDNARETNWQDFRSPKEMIASGKFWSLNGLALGLNEDIWMCEEGELVLWTGNASEPIRYVSRQGEAKTYFYEEALTQRKKHREWMRNGYKTHSPEPAEYPIPDFPMNNF